MRVAGRGAVPLKCACMFPRRRRRTLQCKVKWAQDEVVVGCRLLIEYGSKYGVPGDDEPFPDLYAQTSALMCCVCAVSVHVLCLCICCVCACAVSVHVLCLCCVCTVSVLLLCCVCINFDFDSDRPFSSAFQCAM